VSKLPIPNPTAGVPGIVYINGEKITYYGVDTDTNELLQIRRAVAGTGAPEVHLAFVGPTTANSNVFINYESLVSDASIDQKMPADSDERDWLSANLGLMFSSTTQALYLQDRPSYLPKLP
jgi:hypothetical protein